MKQPSREPYGADGAAEAQTLTRVQAPPFNAAEQRSERIAPATGWWLCPNTPHCPHSGVAHDVEDLDDTRPRCCADGCDCGTNTTRKDDHG